MFLKFANFNSFLGLSCVFSSCISRDDIEDELSTDCKEERRVLKSNTAVVDDIDLTVLSYNLSPIAAIFKHTYYTSGYDLALIKIFLSHDPCILQL